MAGSDSDWAAFGLELVPVEQLDLSLRHLRAGSQPARTDGLATGPLRAIPQQDGSRLVVDGFKRLDAWVEAGLRHVPVLLEPASDPSGIAVQAHRLVLVANSPPRALSAMDEARVVGSLVEQQGLSETQAARTLARRPSWVSKRLALARRASAEVRRAVDSGQCGVTLAYTLARLSAGEQDRLLRTVRDHRLPVAPALALVDAYRSSESPAEREALLADPRTWLDDTPSRRSSRSGDLGLSSAARALLGRFRRLSALLDRFAESLEAMERLHPDEVRLLEAERRAVVAKLAHVMGRERRGETVSPSPATKSSPIEERADGVREGGPDRQGAGEVGRR
jgi:hypothetical protein